MAESLDPALLEPPEPAPIRWWAVLLGALAIVAIGIVAWLLATSGDGTDHASDSSGVVQASTASTPPEQVVPSSTVALVEVTYDAAFLLYPSRLPEGFELCRALDDLQAGDRFCSSQTADTWIQVAVRDPTVARMSQGTAIPALPGAVWLRPVEEPLEIGVLVSSFAAVVVSARGIDADTLSAVVESIPIVADRGLLYAQYELPVDLSALTDEELGSLLANLSDSAEVSGRRDGTEATVHAGTVSLLVQLGATLPELATTVPRPQLVTIADRPVVLGESQERGEMWAIWDQAGYNWRLEGPGTAQDAQSLAADIIGRVADFG